VRLGRRLLIDGAVASSTNLDVAVEAGAELIVVAAPQSYEPDARLPLHLRAAKELFHRRLECELRDARAAGARVLVIRPDAEESHVHGLNLLRSDGHGEVADLSYRRASAALSSDEGRAFAADWRAAA
jgi:predicted acylesterase/phospholipase RssA